MGNLSCNCNKTDNKQQKDEFSMVSLFIYYKIFSY